MINSSDMNLLYFNLDGQYYVIRYYLYDNIKVIYHNSIAWLYYILALTKKGNDID
jgi:hypothetical protein